MGAVRLTLLTAAVVLLVVAVLVALAWGFQRSLIYLPLSGTVPEAAEAVEDARDLTLGTEDGLELGAWYVPPRGQAREQAVLVANGNAGSRQTRVPLAAALADEGFAVLLFDYRGYGGNPGRPSEEGLARDARAAADALERRLGFAPEQTLYVGESLGAAVVTGLARERPPAGLLLRSPFTDLAEAGAHHYPFLPVRTLLWDRYPVSESVRHVEVPTTVVYGSADSIIPPRQSREVAAASAGLFEEVQVRGADHNDRVLLDGPELIGAVVRLADRAGRE